MATSYFDQDRSLICTRRAVKILSMKVSALLEKLQGKAHRSSVSTSLFHKRCIIPASTFVRNIPRRNGQEFLSRASDQCSMFCNWSAFCRTFFRWEKPPREIQTLPYTNLIRPSKFFSFHNGPLIGKEPSLMFFLSAFLLASSVLLILNQGPGATVVNTEALTMLDNQQEIKARESIHPLDLILEKKTMGGKVTQRCAGQMLLQIYAWMGGRGGLSQGS